MHNIHFSVIDLILIASILECLLIYALLIVARPIPTPNSTCQYMLGLIFIAVGLDALAILIVWHVDVREALQLHVSSNFATVFVSFAFTAKGPILLLFMQALISSQLRIRLVHILHFSTFAVASAVAYSNNLDLARITFDVEQTNTSIDGTINWWTIVRLSPCIYAIAAIYTLYKTEKRKIKLDSSGSANQFDYWIKALIWGFSLQWSWNLVVHLAGSRLPQEIAGVLGIINNVSTLLLINALLIYSFRIMQNLAPDYSQPALTHEQDTSSTNAGSISEQNTVFKKYVFSTRNGERLSYLPYQTIPTANQADHEALAAIVSGINEKRLHLKPALNIEKYAENINLTPKDVSRLINTYYKRSFSDFVNAFRVLEAEQLLSSPDHMQLTIIEIINLSGFNSKSAFHRYFKSYIAQSPTEYRKQKSTG